MTGEPDALSPSSRRCLLSALFINFLLYGISITLIGATLPEVILTHGWSYHDSGLVIAGASLGFLLAAYTSGGLISRIGPQTVLVLGLLVQCIGLSFYGTYPLALASFVLVMMISAGEGVSEVVTNCCLLKMEPAEHGRLMNRIHSALPLGAVIGPLLVGSALSNGLGWRWMFETLTVLCALMAIVFGFCKFPRRATDSLKTPVRDEQNKPTSQLLRNSWLRLFAMFAFLYFAMEIGVTSWLAEYGVHAFNISSAGGAYLLGLFWIGLCLGRIGFSLSPLKMSGEKQMALLSALSIAPILIGLLTEHVVVAGVAFFLTGITLSSVFPLAMTLVGKHFRDDHNQAVGIVSAAGGLGPLAFLFVVAPSAQQLGIEAGFWLYALIVIAMSLVAIVIWSKSTSQTSFQQQLGAPSKH